MSDTTIPRKTLIVTYFFSATVLAALWWVAYSGDTILILVASFGGAFAGMLGAMLDHNTLSIKREGWVKMTDPQKAYLVLRACMGTGLGMAAAFVAQGVLAPKPTPESTYMIIAFVAAYVFDVSRLSPTK